jgi:hypothetical protein
MPHMFYQSFLGFFRTFPTASVELVLGRFVFCSGSGDGLKIPSRLLDSGFGLPKFFRHNF